MRRLPREPWNSNGLNGSASSFFTQARSSAPESASGWYANPAGPQGALANSSGCSGASCDIFGNQTRQCAVYPVNCNTSAHDGVTMRAPNGVNGNGQHRQRVADELRQLKQMSKGLRTQAFRAVMDRAANQRAAAKPT